MIVLPSNYHRRLQSTEEGLICRFISSKDPEMDALQTISQQVGRCCIRTSRFRSSERPYLRVKFCPARLKAIMGLERRHDGQRRLSAGKVDLCIKSWCSIERALPQTEPWSQVIKCFRGLSFFATMDAQLLYAAPSH
jgi:hypothetical protein